MKTENYHTIQNFVKELLSKEEENFTQHLTKFAKNVLLNSQFVYNDMVSSAYMKQICSEFLQHFDQTQTKEMIRNYLDVRLISYNFSSSTSEIKSLNEKIEYKALQTFWQIMNSKLMSIKE